MTRFPSDAERLRHLPYVDDDRNRWCLVDDEAWPCDVRRGRPYVDGDDTRSVNLADQQAAPVPEDSSRTSTTTTVGHASTSRTGSRSTGL